MKAVIDIETGGFSITKNAICEIGILIVNDALQVVEENSWIIKPYTREDSEELCSYKEDAMAVNGIPMEEIENGIEARIVSLELKKLFRKHNVKALIGHNAIIFDVPRLQYLVNRFLGQSILMYEVEDTLRLSKLNLNLPCNKLGSVCDHFGISNKDSHRTLGDCYATLEVYKKLIEL